MWGVKGRRCFVLEQLTMEKKGKQMLWMAEEEEVICLIQNFLFFPKHPHIHILIYHTLDLIPSIIDFKLLHPSHMSTHVCVVCGTTGAEFTCGFCRIPRVFLKQIKLIL